MITYSGLNTFLAVYTVRQQVYQFDVPFKIEKLVFYCIDLTYLLQMAFVAERRDITRKKMNSLWQISL